MTSWVNASAQVVAFPQQQQPGHSEVNVTDNTYTLSNDLFSASFKKEANKLIFNGCEAMDLMEGTDLFSITMSNGTTITSSDMTLGTVATKPLQGDAKAAKGSERYSGNAIEAQFSNNDMNVVWRAVLRNGSHYLRTEMEITAKRDIQLPTIKPMLYNVSLASGATAPAVVGNTTHGAILASDKIFAGLETPMGINSVGGSTNYNDFNPYGWNSSTFNWSPGSETPQAILNLGLSTEQYRGVFTTSQIVGTRGLVNFPTAGNNTVTFTYSSGDHRLNVVGVDVLSADGSKVVASDYHIGYTGHAASNNVYNLNIPSAGTYLIRFFVEVRTETVSSSGNITYNYNVTKATGSAGTIVPIEGRWERKATLAIGNTWNVSAVVGLMAPGQKRRSVLAYSERERAVPWRPMPIYNSWYELNIDRNNSPTYANHFTIDECVDVMNQWKKNLFDKHGSHIESFVWDDGWDSYGTWDFNPNFPHGFQEADAVGRAMGSSLGTWLGPVGGYGTSGNLRRAYWNDKGGMQLSNPRYFETFLTACSNMVNNYQFNFFKFDGISDIAEARGPKTSDPNGIESAEGIIELEQRVRQIKPDIFLNTTVGTWASPFWFHYADAIWRQEADYSERGPQGTDREKWITYRDYKVYTNYVEGSPLCPINTMMTHGVILSTKGAVSKNMDYQGVLRELRCGFVCGSGMVELYCDYERLNNINNGALWADIAECIEWQKKNADVLPDIHWVGGNPYTGSTYNVYGWASWNGKKATLALRNPSTQSLTYSFKLRDVLDIPAFITGSITLNKAFSHSQANLPGLTEGTPINIDTQLTVTLAGSSLYVFDGADPNSQMPEVEKPESDVVLEWVSNQLEATNVTAKSAEVEIQFTVENLPEGHTIGAEALLSGNQTPVKFQLNVGENPVSQTLSFNDLTPDTDHAYDVALCSYNNGEKVSTSTKLPLVFRTLKDTGGVEDAVTSDVSIEIVNDMAVFKNVDKASIFDVSGRAVREIEDASYPAYVGNLAKGIYVVRMQNGPINRSSKLVID